MESKKSFTFSDYDRLYCYAESLDLKPDTTDASERPELYINRRHRLTVSAVRRAVPAAEFLVSLGFEADDADVACGQFKSALECLHRAAKLRQTQSEITKA